MHAEVPIEDRLRTVAERVQLLQDAAGVVVLVPAAWMRVRSASTLELCLGLVEGATIVLACASAARELLGSAHAHERSRFDWLNAFLGTVLLAEWGFAVGGGGKPVSPTLLTALTAWTLALAGPRLAAWRGKLRRMKVDDTHFLLSPSLLRRFRVAWLDLDAIEETGGGLRFRLRDGSTRRLSLRRYANRDEMLRVLREAAAEQGVPHEPRPSD